MKVQSHSSSRHLNIQRTELLPLQAPCTTTQYTGMPTVCQDRLDTVDRHPVLARLPPMGCSYVPSTRGVQTRLYNRRCEMERRTRSLNVCVCVCLTVCVCVRASQRVKSNYREYREIETSPSFF